MKKSLTNLAYYLSLVRMTDKTYFIPLFLQTCALVLIPAVNVLLPGILLADIMEGSIRTLAGDFGILAVISAAASFPPPCSATVSWYCGKEESWKTAAMRN